MTIESLKKQENDNTPAGKPIDLLRNLQRTNLKFMGMKKNVPLQVMAIRGP